MTPAYSRITKTGVKYYLSKRLYSITPLIRMLVIRIANHRDRLGTSGKFVKNSTKLMCPEITGYLI